MNSFSHRVKVRMRGINKIKHLISIYHLTPTLSRKERLSTGLH